MAQEASRDGLMGILAIPVFHGPKSWGAPSDALSPEEWLRRMEQAQKRQGWTATQTTQQAWANLRGQAWEYFYYNIPGKVSEEEYNELQTDWTTFSATFKDVFFTSETAHDLGLQWRKILNQGANESVDAFFNKTTALSYQYRICLLYTSPSPRDS